MEEKTIRVLLIEDKLEDAQRLENLLEDITSVDFELTRANRLQKGLQILEAQNFDVLLLDLSLPDSEGEETFQRASTYVPEIPIVILSGLDDELLALRAVKEGVQDYLVKKNVNSDMLLRAIRYAIERKQLELQIVQLNRKLKTTVRYKTEALKKIREDYKKLVQALPDIIYKIDPDGLFTFINDSVRFLGYEPSELMGKHFSILLHPHDVAKVSRVHVLPGYKGRITGPEQAPKLFDERRGIQRRTSGLEVRLLKKDGDHQKEDMGMIGSVIAFGEVNAIGQYEGQYNEKDDEQDGGQGEEHFLGTLGIIRDVTQRKQLEKAFHYIVEGTSGVVGADFFTSLAHRVSLALQVDCVLVGQYKPGKHGEIQSLALWREGKLEENFSFSIKGTPVEKIVQTKDFLYVPCGVSSLFPGDTSLVDMKAESYLGVPLLDSSRKVLGILSVCKKSPLGPENQIQSILRLFAARASAELKRLRLENLKENFIATVNHELRTPLTVLYGALRLLESKELPSELAELTNMAVRNARQLQNLIDDLRLLHQNPKAEYSPQVFPVVSEIQKALQEIQPLKQGITVSLQTSLSAKTQVVGHLPWFQKILSKLLSNALSFSPTKGEVIVSLERKGLWIQIGVQDRGQGIPAGMESAIFEKFFQIDSSPSRKKEGTGLGLAITKRLVEAQGGEIFVGSPESGGAIFFFTLPEKMPEEK